jgi:hypothetical protein
MERGAIAVLVWATEILLWFDNRPCGPDDQTQRLQWDPESRCWRSAWDFASEVAFVK